MDHVTGSSYVRRTQSDIISMALGGSGPAIRNSLPRFCTDLATVDHMLSASLEPRCCEAIVAEFLERYEGTYPVMNY